MRELDRSDTTHAVEVRAETEGFDILHAGGDPTRSAALGRRPGQIDPDGASTGGMQPRKRLTIAAPGVEHPRARVDPHQRVHRALFLTAQRPIGHAARQRV
jgi:hypothetical protein